MNYSLFFRKLHKWLALIIGVQVVLWAFSGLYMTAIDIEIIHGDHLVKTTKLPSLKREEIIPLSDLELRDLGENSSAAVKSVGLIQTPFGPEYQIEALNELIRIDARTGQALSAIDKDTVKKLAEFYYAGEAKIDSIKLLDSYPRELGGKPQPIWQVSYDDWLASTLYFLPDTGNLRSKRSDLWRWFDFLWMLHIMDYESREEINNNLLRIASILGVLMALAGLLLFISRIKAGYRSGKSWRSRIQMIHKIAITVVGVQVVIWLISGMMFSILPQQKVSGAYLLDRQTQENFQINDANFSETIERYPDATKIKLKSILSRKFYDVTSSKNSMLISAESLEETELNKNEIQIIADSVFKGEAKFDTVLFESEKTYENRKFELPVWKVNYTGDENPSLYVSTSGRVLGVKTDTWRLFDFFWMLHIMDYSERSDFNHLLIIVAALFKLVVVFSGVWLLFLVFRKNKVKR